MKANQMMEVVARAEQELHDKVSELISDYINLISKETGLDVGGVTFSTVESTNIDSTEKEWRVNGCHIDVDLPNKMAMFY